MNEKEKEIVGGLLLIVGMTDNIFNWLTPLKSSVGAALDGLLILGGAYLLFNRDGTVFKTTQRFWVGATLIFIGLTDNVFSWLTPLNAQGAFFDGFLLLAGSYLAFKRSG